MGHFDFWSVRFLQYTILRASTCLVNIVNITSYEAHNPIVTQKTLVLSCCSDDGRIERKNDFHNFWMNVYPTYSINGNLFPVEHIFLNMVSEVPIVACSISGAEKTCSCRGALIERFRS